ncbi:hypothetical protein Peur_042969 [Populus x canadensis]
MGSNPGSEKGVRREVGNHAKALNKVLLKTEVNSMVSIRDDLIDSQQATEQNLGPLLSKEGRPFSPNSTNSHLLLETANKTRQTGQILVSPSIIAAEEGTAKDKVPDAAGRGGPVSGAGKDENKKD